MDDRTTVAVQLGRDPRGSVEVVARCQYGLPLVIRTSPLLDDGTPFPTLYYLTCPVAVREIGRLEAAGTMREMEARLEHDEQLREAYTRAHERYIAQRDAIERLDEPSSAGGMPTRVKCLHVHLAHTLACGPGVNPFGDETLELLRPDWPSGDCAV